jgi:hypothetical protein
MRGKTQIARDIVEHSINAAKHVDIPAYMHALRRTILFIRQPIVHLLLPLLYR